MNIVKHPNIFFTADRHFYHQFMIDRGIRKFSSVEEMNATLVSRHNEVVRKGDLVYDLGDQYLKTKPDKAWEVQKQMVGNFYAIEGNHDETAQKLAKEGAYVWFRQLEDITIREPYFESGQTIILCHYAMRVWRNSHRGSWQLYGHSHGMLKEIPELLSFDIGVDCWDYYPVSIEQVKAKMAEKMPAWQAYRDSLKDTGRVE